MSLMGHGETNSPRAFLVGNSAVSGPSGGGTDGLLSANNGLMHRSKEHPYSITSSAKM
jgi:hypothetical protein